MNLNKSEKITRSDFAKLVNETNGATFVTFISKTKPIRRKGSDLFDRVEKISRVNGQLNFDYEEAVNNKREKEGSTRDFQSSSRKWGTKLPNKSIVENNGKMYLHVRILKSLEEPTYLLDGKQVDKTIVESELPKKTSSATKQGVSQEVVVRDFDLKNIVEVSFNKRQLILID